MKTKKMVLSVLLFFAPAVWAAKSSGGTKALFIPSHFRFFVTQNTFTPDNLNTELSAAGIGEYKADTGVVLEADWSLLSWMRMGIRAQSISNTKEGPLSGGYSTYADLQQSNIGGILRVALLQTPILSLEGFVEGGPSNTTVRIRDSTGKDKYASPSSGNSSTYSRYGASLGIGFKGIFLYVEGGPEYNKATKLEETGTRTGAITRLDLSGTYAAIGIVLDTRMIDMN